MANFDDDNKNITSYGEVYCYDDKTVLDIKERIKNMVY